MAQTTLAQVLADVLTLSDADKHVVLTTLIALGQAPTSGKATAPESVPTPVQRTYEPATDVELPLIPAKAGKGKVAFYLGYGKARKGAGMMLEAHGFVKDKSYDTDNGAVSPDGKTHHVAYVGSCKNTLGLTSKSTSLTVTAEWVQAGRDKAAEKAARKAGKGA